MDFGVILCTISILEVLALVSTFTVFGIILPQTTQMLCEVAGVVCLKTP